MTNRISINTDNLKTIPEWITNIDLFVRLVLKELNYSNWELSIVFCEDDFIQNLNNQYRQINTPTDVLSFPQESTYIDEQGNEVFEAGDIVISIPALMRNTRTFNVRANEELKRLLIHGILHLSGLDHGDLHVGSDGHILDDDGNEVLLATEEYNMLVLQETLMQKFIKETIIEE